MTTMRETPDLVGRGPGTPRGSKIPYVVFALVLALAVGAFAWSQLADDDAQPSGIPAPSASASPSTSASPTPTTPPPLDRATVIWPFAGTTYDDPVALTRAFATTYLRFAAPVVGSFRRGDTRSGEVDVRPIRTGPATTVLVRQVGPGDSWYVIGATTPTIEVTSPETGALVGSPLRITGRAVAFEGTVRVEVRQDGEVGALGSGFVTGGGDEMRPFDGTIPFREPTQRYGTVVLYTASGENGQVWVVAALRVRLT